MNSIASIKGRTSKYERTALMLRQEAREHTNDETYIITEEDEDEYNVVGVGQGKKTEDQMDEYNEILRKNRKKNIGRIGLNQ